VTEMYQFTSDWAQEIAEISTLPQFQTATVRLEDPSLVTTEYDVETGEYVTTGDPVLYEGRARVIGINRGAFQSNEGQANPTTITAVRVQLPREYERNGVTIPTGSIRVQKGCILYVTSAPRQPVLVNNVFTATSDFQGATSAARTLEFALDGDSTPPSGGYGDSPYSAGEYGGD